MHSYKNPTQYFCQNKGMTNLWAQSALMQCQKRIVLGLKRLRLSFLQVQWLGTEIAETTWWLIPLSK